MAHFSFTRSLYDDCSLDKRNTESSGPGNYATDKQVIESKESCFQAASPFQHNPYHSVPMNSVDIESELRGQTRNLSNCPSQKYNPNQPYPVDYVVNECADDRLVPEYTRINKPCNVFAGITINRFHPLCEDLQDLNKIHSNTYVGANTRLHVKDAFKAKNASNTRPHYDFVIDNKTPCQTCANLIYP